MLYVHPVMQLVATLLAFYVLTLGWKRVQSLHLGLTTSFKRGRHAFLGKVAMGLWLLGLIGGLIIVRVQMGGWMVSDTHGPVAMVALPFLLFGLASGLYLERKPAKRKLLPALHGLCNTTMLGLAVLQAITGGWWTIRLLGH